MVLEKEVVQRRTCQKNIKMGSDLSKEGLRYMKIMLTGWLQSKGDWKGFASCKGLSKLFKVHKG